MKALSIFKNASVLATSIGVSSIVTNAVKFVTPIAAMNPVMKVCVTIGSFALSTMISDTTSKWAGDQIDLVADGIKKISDEIENESKEDDEKPIKDNQSDDFQKFRENCLKDCVNAYKPFKEDDENGES